MAAASRCKAVAAHMAVSADEQALETRAISGPDRLYFRVDDRIGIFRAIRQTLLSFH